ncbi:MAG: SDR family NAD(P)-dependent oxidoreductase [Gammaproteobacteria bacterium]|nr:SDR family NAD(P)-dependent oxidoreductase [Gammaproteobacteria bacterium]MDD9896790.1 SDR family NAD(P)-dependent oxidoreductase [Gammaproteobacteria bacterium]MDD9959356.1 SDR family NAD(P)-dependent oxidoreductase [Gammaproteobacteria bacterium]
MNILITGATSGIGKQLAIDYLEGGHTVFCCGRNTAALQELTQQYPATAVSLSFDVSNLAQCATALKNVPALDIVILNAGTCEYVNAEKFDAELFARVMRINLDGTANCLQFLIPKIQSEGTLALMGSSSSYLPLPRAEAYGASKAAIEYLAATLRISLANANVKVSYIAPGFVETPLTDLNDFPMPMRVDVHYASREIRRGLAANKRQIHFPRRFTWILKVIGMLPLRIQQYLIAKTLAY